MERSDTAASAPGAAVFVLVTAIVCLLGSPAIQAAEPTTTGAGDQATDTYGVQIQTRRLKLKGNAKFWGQAIRLGGSIEAYRLWNTPAFLVTGVRMDREKRLPYDLQRWGGEWGLGWQVNDAIDVIGSYRFDHYHVFNVSPDGDPDFGSVAGGSQTTALGLLFRYDTRDDTKYPMKGMSHRVSTEMALEGLGGDYNFARLQYDGTAYYTPETGTWLDQVTFVERFLTGWVENFGETADVPFFERYFVGGTKTVRGHRSRWLTPRGDDDQFVGGEIQVVNNVEARMPILTQWFERNLYAATFFDVGRAYRRASEIGDFGYGVGGGLRYVLRIRKVSTVLRADYGVSFDSEGDDSRGHWHFSIGMPF